MGPERCKINQQSVLPGASGVYPFGEALGEASSAWMGYRDIKSQSHAFASSPAKLPSSAGIIPQEGISPEAQLPTP